MRVVVSSLAGFVFIVFAGQNFDLILQVQFLNDNQGDRGRSEGSMEEKRLGGGRRR